MLSFLIKKGGKMKNLVDSYVTIILFTIMIFAIASFGTLQMQILCARHLHNSVVDMFQNSFYSISIEDINKEIQKSFPLWHVESKMIESVGSRQSHLVTLHYNIVLPIFGIEEKGMLNAYAK